MYYTYVMGIDNSIFKLEQQGFLIENDGPNYKVIFLFHLEDGFRRYIK